MMHSKAKQNFIDSTNLFISEVDSFANRLKDEDAEVLYDQRASHLTRGKLGILVSSEETRIDGVIFRLYRGADTLISLVEDKPQYRWVTLRMKFILIESLAREASLIIMSPDKLKCLLDPADALMRQLVEVEESDSQKIV